MRLLLVTLPFATLFACAHAQKPPETTEVATPKPAVAAAPAPAPNTCKVDTECQDGSLCLHGQCVAITPDLEECSVMRVHFGFNDATLQPDDEQMLQRMGRCLRAASKLHVTIEGNADERGTEEYNLMLGGQRASAVERYLKNLGAAQSQLDTISYGYEKPTCTEHNEACWAKNRRAALKPDAKGPGKKP